MNQNYRTCYICYTAISGCMGYVRAGDFSRLLVGEINRVRESCGKCVERVEIATGGRLPSTEKSLDFIASRIRKQL